MILRGAEREEERRLILGGAWPYFPILPIKRSEGEPDLGLLVWRYVAPGRETTAGPWRVYLANLIEVSLGAEGKTWEKALTDVEWTEYPTLDDLFDAGWRGD